MQKIKQKPKTIKDWIITATKHTIGLTDYFTYWLKVSAFDVEGVPFHCYEPILYLQGDEVFTKSYGIQRYYKLEGWGKFDDVKVDIKNFALQGGLHFPINN